MRITTLYGLFFCLLTVVGGCVKKKNHSRKASAVSADVFVCEHEARLVDVPIPLGACPIKRFSEQQQSTPSQLLGYIVYYSTEELIDYYTYEMERLGWDQRVQHEGAEAVLVFNKPKRIAIISMRPIKNQKVELVLLVSSLY